MALPRIESGQKFRKEFVDRTHLITEFESAVHMIPLEGRVIRVFHGVGGQGKTALRLELERRVNQLTGDAESQFVRSATIDFHGINALATEDMFVALRNVLGNLGVPFPAFDIGLALLWQVWRPASSMPRLTRPWLHQTRTAAGDVISDLGQGAASSIGTELLGETLKSVPGAGPILNRISTLLIDRVHRAYIEKSRDYLKHLFMDGGLKPIHELLSLMPWLLAQDLNTYLKKDHRRRFVLFVDEYEKVLLRPGREGGFRKNDLDAHLQRFISETSGLLVCFFSRVPLSWGAEWNEELSGNQFKMVGLPETDADHHLQAVPIEDEAIRKAIIDGAKETSDARSHVYPLLLDFQLDHWINLTEAGYPVRPADFKTEASELQARKKEIVERLLRDYSEVEQKVLLRLSWMPRFDKGVFEQMISEFKIPTLVESFEQLSRISFINIGIDAHYHFHEAVAEILRDIQRPSRRVEMMDFGFRVFSSRSVADEKKPFRWPQLAAVVDAAQCEEAVSATEFIDFLKERRSQMLKSAFHEQAFNIWGVAAEKCRLELGEHHSKTGYCLFVQGQMAIASGDLEAGTRKLNEAQAAGFNLTRKSISALITISPTSEMARHWLDHVIGMHKRWPEPSDAETLTWAFNSYLETLATEEEVNGALSEMVAHGLIPDAYTFSTRMKRASSLRAANALLAEMKFEGIRPAEYHFNILLSKARGSMEIDAVMDLMRAAGYERSTIAFNQMLDKASGPEELDRLLDEMRENRVERTVVTYTTAIKKSGGGVKARAYYEAMREENIEADEYVFGTLIICERTFAAAYDWLTELRRARLPLDSFMAMHLARKVGNLDEASQFIELLAQYEIVMSPGLLGALANNTLSKAGAADWPALVSFWRARARDFQLQYSKPLCNSFLGSCPDVATGLALVADLVSEGCLATDIGYQLLLSKAQSQEDVDRCLADMRSRDVEISGKMYEAMLLTENDFAEARVHFDAIRAMGEIPSRQSFGHLIDLCGSVDCAIGILDEFLSDGLVPSEDINSRFVGCVANLADAERLLTELHARQVILGQSICAGLAKRIAVEMPVEEFLEWVEANCASPDQPIAAAIKALGDVGEIERSLDLCLRNPLADAARGLFRRQREAVDEELARRLAKRPNDFDLLWTRCVFELEADNLAAANLLLKKAQAVAKTKGLSDKILAMFQKLSAARG